MKDIINEIRRQLKANPDKPVMLSARRAEAIVNAFESGRVAIQPIVGDIGVATFKHDARPKRAKGGAS